jgi:glycosyltransferase involved in cell wall biosynthesis
MRPPVPTEARAASPAIGRPPGLLVKTARVWRTEGTRAVVERGARWILRHLLPAPMTWRGYLFDTVKRARHGRCARAFDAVSCPSEPGLVSIVLPVHNGERYLTEALDSVVRQTYARFELIVVDDGSHDATAAILAEYAAKDARLRIARQDHQGLPRALSAGFRLARGEFLTWTSDDNRLTPDFLARMVGCLRRHPTWDMVYANEDIVGPDGRRLLHSPWFANYQEPPGTGHVALPADPSELNTYPNNYVGAAFMYRDRVGLLLGDYSRLRAGTEDYDYWMRVNLFMNLRHADFAEPVYEYRFHSASLTSRDEQLGITRGRGALMVFDDFRRDFALAPLALVLEHATDRNSRALARKIARWAARGGHVLLERARLQGTSAEPRGHWLPLVYASVVETPPPSAAPAPVPTAALTVLIVTGADPLPADVDPSWDLCVTTRPRARLPRTRAPQQGWLAIPDPDVLCAAIDVRARSRQLARIETEIATASAGCKMSVVICTYRRPALLARSVGSVARQTFSATDYEVIVVDNDPGDRRTAEAVAALQRSAFGDRPQRLRLVQCPFPGLSFARNAGLADARGAVVCFLDDDAAARADWLAELWRVYEDHPRAGVVGGTILLEAPDPPPRWVRPGWEKFWSQYLPGDAQPHEVTLERFPYGANWSARREALLAIGGFRGRYGRRGRNFGGGEEIVAACLVQRLGYAIMAAPRAEVVHRPDPSRFALRDVWRTAMGATRSWYAQHRDLYRPMDLTPKRLLKWTALELGAALRPGRPAHDRLERLMRAAGNAAVLVRLLRDEYARRRRPVALSS